MSIWVFTIGIIPDLESGETTQDSALGEFAWSMSVSDKKFKDRSFTEW